MNIRFGVYLCIIFQLSLSVVSNMESSYATLPKCVCKWMNISIQRCPPHSTSFYGCIVYFVVHAQQHADELTPVGAVFIVITISK